MKRIRNVLLISLMAMSLFATVAAEEPEPPPTDTPSETTVTAVTTVTSPVATSPSSPNSPSSPSTANSPASPTSPNETTSLSSAASDTAAASSDSAPTATSPSGASETSPTTLHIPGGTVLHNPIPSDYVPPTLPPLTTESHDFTDTPAATEEPGSDDGTDDATLCGECNEYSCVCSNRSSFLFLAVGGIFLLGILGTLPLILREIRLKQIYTY